MQELDLGGNLIDDVAAVEVLETMPELRILILEKNPIANYNGRSASVTMAAGDVHTHPTVISRRCHPPSSSVSLLMHDPSYII